MGSPFPIKPKKNDTRQKGNKAEQLAFEFLLTQNLIIVAKNFRSYFGEIDLVALHDNTLVFVEVRSKKNKDYGDPIASIHYFKQQKIIKTAKFFLLQNPKYATLACRFDIIGIVINNKTPTINWVKNAFWA